MYKDIQVTSVFLKTAIFLEVFLFCFVLFLILFYF